MPLQATSGAASYDAFGGGVAAVPNYIEECFATHLYTGNDSAQTITNGVDLAGKGGLVWVKARNQTYSHILSDTSRGTGKFLSSNTTDAQGTDAQDVTAFNANGFTVGNNARINNSSFNYVSWTFREQPKFFDVVTYTGDGSAPRAISHSLGSTPGCIMIKKTSATGDWWVFHRSAPNQGAAYPNIGGNLYLNYTDAADSGTNPFLSAVGSTTFTLSTNQNTAMNASGATYVAYLFAHNAGGFGLTGTDNVISCGSVVTDGLGGATVNLGYEPQWVLWKRADGTGNWHIIDTMRGMSQTGASFLNPNTSGAESVANGTPSPFTATATGFQTTGYWINNSLHIYIAIRRGPMKVPTTGTSVFTPIARAGTSATATVTSGFTTDAVITKARNTTYAPAWFSRLRGANRFLFTFDPQEENTTTNSLTSWASNTGYVLGADNEAANINFTANYVNYALGRAPGFFDVVSTSGSSTPTSHNLGVAPELIFRKRLDFSSNPAVMNWSVTSRSLLGNGQLILNSTAAYDGSVFILDSVTSTQINWGSLPGGQMVLYLFASCPGVSKVGTFTGTGATQTINCGFTGGARFVLIKATSTTGNWLVWDTARGMIPANDPYLALNSTAAEVTNTDWVDTAATGFELSNAGGNLANSNGVSYIFLAIA